MTSSLINFLQSLNPLSKVKLSIRLEPVAKHVPPPKARIKGKSRKIFFQRLLDLFRDAKPAVKEPQKPSTSLYFEVIGLGEVKEKYIHHWPAIRDKIHQIAELIIKKSLKEGECFEVLSSDQYIVTLKGSGAETTIRAEDIREAIRHLFIKNANLLNHLDIKVKVESSDREEETSERNAFKNAQHSKARLIFRASVQERLFSKSSSTLRPVLIRDENGNTVMPAPLEFLHKPVWNVGKKQFEHLNLYTKYTMEDGTILEEYDVLPEDADDDMILAYDLRLLRRAIYSAKRAGVNCSAPMRIMCPVHYKSISDPRRGEAYLKTFQALWSMEKERPLITLRLIQMPRSLYGPELQAPLRILLSIAEKIIVMSPLDRTGGNGLREAGATAVGLDLSLLQNIPLPLLEKKMRNFTKNANREKLRTFAFGVDNDERMKAAEKAGFGFLCGKAVPGQVDEEGEALHSSSPSNQESTLPPI